MRHNKGNVHRLSLPNYVYIPPSRPHRHAFQGNNSSLGCLTLRDTRRYTLPCNLENPKATSTEVTNVGIQQCSEQSSSCSSACQWSAEEQILAKQKQANQIDSHKVDSSLLYSDLPGQHADFHDPTTYVARDYKYAFPHSPLTDHNPSLGRVFGHPHHTHHSKMGTDPTILLTLARWARIGTSRVAGDDDLVDRLNYQLTSLILLLLVTLTGMRQYLSHLPLQCWIPQEFSRSWEEYAEHYCWVTNTYFAEVKDRLPDMTERSNVVRYYQWATFVLILQAVGFIIPCFIWRMLQNLAGFHVQRVMRGAMQINSSPATAMSQTVRQLGQYVDAVICYRHHKQWQRKSLYEWCQPTASVKRDPRQSVHVNPISETSLLIQPAGSSKSVHFQRSSPVESERHSDEKPVDSVAVGIAEHLSLRKSKKSRAPSPPYLVRNEGLPPAFRSGSLKLPGTQPHDQAKFTRQKSSGKSKGKFGCTQCLCPLVKVHSQKNQTEKVVEVITKQQGQVLEKFNQAHDTDTVGHVRRNWLITGCCICHNSSYQYRRDKPTQHKPTQENHPISRKPPAPIMCGHLRPCLHVIRNLITSSFRLFAVLVCLIPNCLCHWSLCCQGNKRLKRSHAFIFYLYLTVKLFYVANLLGQIYFMKVFLGAESLAFGFLLMRDLVRGQAWQQTGNFPRVTFCDFEAKKLGKNYKYTLQCVLPLNLFLEKMYVFLWLWMVFLSLLTTFNLFKWLCRLSIEKHRIEFVRKYIVSMKNLDDSVKENERLLKVFTNKYLERDGLFLLWMIATNAGDVVAAEMMSILWDLFSLHLVRHQTTSTVFPDHFAALGNDAFEQYQHGATAPYLNNWQSTVGRTEYSCRHLSRMNHPAPGNPCCQIEDYKFREPTVLNSSLTPSGTTSTVFVNLSADDPWINDQYKIDSSNDSIV